MNFLRLKLRKLKGNAGSFEEVDACINLTAITYVDMANRDTRLVVRFQGDMNLYFVEDKESIARLLSAIDDRDV